MRQSVRATVAGKGGGEESRQLALAPFPASLSHPRSGEQRQPELYKEPAVSHHLLLFFFFSTAVQSSPSIFLVVPLLQQSLHLCLHLPQRHSPRDSLRSKSSRDHDSEVAHRQLLGSPRARNEPVLKHQGRRP